jgi:small subunit ribosomal protein S6
LWSRNDHPFFRPVASPPDSGRAKVCRKTNGPWGEVTCRVRKYEFIYILDPTVEDNAVADSLARYAKLVRDQGGEVTHQEVWGRRRFAYEIHHKTEGSYVFMRLRAVNKVIDELNRALRFDERVVRSLIVLDEEAEARNAEAQKNVKRPMEHDIGAAESRAGV